MQYLQKAAKSEAEVLPSLSSRYAVSTQSVFDSVRRASHQWPSSCLWTCQSEVAKSHARIDISFSVEHDRCSVPTVAGRCTLQSKSTQMFSQDVSLLFAILRGHAFMRS